MVDNPILFELLEELEELLDEDALDDVVEESLDPVELDPVEPLAVEELLVDELLALLLPPPQEARVIASDATINLIYVFLIMVFPHTTIILPLSYYSSIHNFKHDLKITRIPIKTQIN